jgi:FkbH-like protein
MKLIEALQLQHNAPDNRAEALRVFLGCGFTPLHLHTLLTAELQVCFSNRRVEIETGLYGDLLGSVEAVASIRPVLAAVIVEWPDLDPRLGIRSPSSWLPADEQDILGAAERKLAVLACSIASAAEVCPLALVLPTLPLPPVAFRPGVLESELQLGLRQALLAFASQLRVRQVSSEQLDRRSPHANRWDVNANLLSGFPYKVSHAAQIASLIAQALCPGIPKKGIITDLDDTLWRGLLGDIGAAGISWDLDHGSQHHALYQLLLRSLADTGVLVGVASGNDPGLVRKVFDRPDILIGADQIFPFEVHWGRKSLSVARILECWNVGADSVVFIDDSPMDLAEVRAEYPAMECIRFPQDDPAAVVELLYRLRDLFGKSALSAEDGSRRQSLRESERFAPAPGATAEASNDLLREAGAEIAILYSKDFKDPRPLELVNKTNQFNLNGRRWTESEWRDFLECQSAFQMVVSYKDKYSALGKIAVLAGRQEPAGLRVSVWVMSCRAFARHIEYSCLAALLKHFAAERIVFDFAATASNGPLRTRLEQLIGRVPEGPVTLTGADFRARCPTLYHRVVEASDER